MSLVTDSATWMTTSHGNDNDDLGNRKTTSLRGIYDSKGFLDALFRVFDVSLKLLMVSIVRLMIRLE